MNMVSKAKILKPSPKSIRLDLETVTFQNNNLQTTLLMEALERAVEKHGALVVLNKLSDE